MGLTSQMYTIAYIAEAYITRIITMTQLYELEAENEFMLFTQPLVKE